jgi:uncharacterized protein YkwD
MPSGPSARIELAMSRRLQLLALATLASAAIAAALAGLALARGPHGPFGAAMLRSLNRLRAQHHLPVLALDAPMSREATAHSRDMALHGYFSHGAWSGRVAHAAGRASSLGEVLGWLAPASPGVEAARMTESWLSSPEHRQVLLDGRFRRVGIGRSRGGTAIYTVDFASAR